MIISRDASYGPASIIIIITFVIAARTNVDFAGGFRRLLLLAAFLPI